MNNSQVAHLWANKSKQQARGSNFYFEGDTLYSYGSHFPVAKHVQISGEEYILFNDSAYSLTTNRHQREAWRAIAADKRDRLISVSDRDLFNSIALEIEQGVMLKGKTDTEGRYIYRKVTKRDIQRWKRENEKRALKRAHEDHEARKARARQLYKINKEKREQRKKDMEALALKLSQEMETLPLEIGAWRASEHSKETLPLILKRYVQWNGRIALNHYVLIEKGVIKSHENYALLLAAEPDIAIYNSRIEERLRVEKEERERQESIRISDAIVEWRAGERTAILYNVPIMLRLSPDKKRIQTSRGAEILTVFAVKAWPKLRTINENFKEDFDWGNFKGIEVFRVGEARFLKVGCHDIPFSEVEAIAKQLGLE